MSEKEVKDVMGENALLDTAKRIVEHIDQMAEKGGKYEDAVKYTAKEIQVLCRVCILETLGTMKKGCVDMADALITVTKALL